jgi:hypothetical protein
VDIKTQGSLVPGQYINYRYLLNNTGSFNGGVAIGDYASDDVQLVDGATQQQALAFSDYYGFFAKSYSWQPVIFPSTGNYYKDQDWDNPYANITNANVVINEVPAATDATEAQKKELIAEGLVHRADAYLMLVNTYARPYNAATASDDPGVPLVLVETTTQSLSRQSVKEVYDQIISDLKTAAPSLPATQTYNMQPSKASAFGELARCYLYMNLYDSANRYADSALSYRSTLDDLGSYNAPLDGAVYPMQKNDPELLLVKNAAYSVTGYSPYALRLSDTLLSVLGTTDQRYALFTTDAATISSSYTDAGGRFFYKDRAMYETRNVGPTVPEMMLIKAEYYARSNDAASAMSWVNKLRVKRFKAADYVALTATDANDALVQVIRERQREFFCRLLRWWDMRRLKSETRFQQTLTRSFGGTTYTLDPASNRYVFQIAPYYLKLNPEIQQNP